MPEQFRDLCPDGSYRQWKNVFCFDLRPGRNILAAGGWPVRLAGLFF
jgi:hypothetical protein